MTNYSSPLVVSVDDAPQEPAAAEAHEEGYKVPVAPEQEKE
jgi:hypothetical protein